MRVAQSANVGRHAAIPGNPGGEQVAVVSAHSSSPTESSTLRYLPSIPPHPAGALHSYKGMERYSLKVLPPSALAIGIYFVILASVKANIQQGASWKPPEGRYGLESWTHEPMYVDEPRWILLSPRTRGQSSSEESDDNRFWVSRGKKRYWRSPSLLDRGFHEDDEDDLWGSAFEKYPLNRGGKADALEWSAFVNREKRDLSTALDQDSFRINRSKRDSVSNMLSQDPYWANRGKKGDLSSTLGNGDQFWVNRGKKGDLQSPLESRRTGKKSELQDALSSGDRFWVNRGKKSEIQSLLGGEDQFWVNKGKKNELRPMLDRGDQFWGNMGKKNEIQSLLNSGDQFWVNRGKKNELQTLLDGGDQFWVSRGKKSGLQSTLDGGEQFWVNRGKKSDIQSELEGRDQFWVNRGKKSGLQSTLDGGEQFWVNRGKKSDIQSELEGRDQFWVNRSKKSGLQSTLDGGEQFWVNRGKKSDIQSELEGRDQFWVNRGKKSDLQSMLQGGDQFWVNRGKKSNLQSMLEDGDQFWVNRGKKNELKTTLNGADQFWVNRGKKNELQTTLNNGDQFWVNRGKKSNGRDPFWVNRGKQSVIRSSKGFQSNHVDANYDDSFQNIKDTADFSFTKYLPPSGSLFWSDSGWNERLKKDPLKTILKQDPFFVNRGKKGSPLDKQQGNTNETHLRGRRKRQNTYWLDRGKKTNNDPGLDPGPGPGPENRDRFWVARGKRLEVHNRRKRSLVTENITKPSLVEDQDKNTVSPSQGSPRHKRTAESSRVTSYGDHPFKKDDVDSLVLWWKDKPILSDFEDSIEEDFLVETPTMRWLKEDPFWVNRGKKDLVFEGEFLEEKRADREVPSSSETSSPDTLAELGSLTQSQPAETFWVARG